MDNSRMRDSKRTQTRILRFAGVYPQQACASLIASELSMGSSYAVKVLHRLRRKGLVRERKWAEWMPREKGRPRKYYELTPAGRVVLAGMPRDPAPKQERASASEGNWVEWMQANA